MTTKTYCNPNILDDMATADCWPIEVAYTDNSDAVIVRCGQWGKNHWLPFTMTYARSELPERIVAQRYRLESDQ